MKKPWHNRNNTKGRHRRPRRTAKHARQNVNKRTRAQTKDCATLTFKEPVSYKGYTSSANGKYRSRFRANGKPGTRPEAVILDMDGTLENWDGFPNPDAMEYAQKHHDQGRVLIIVTARDHDWSYKRTHDWLMRHLNMPFVGPICRPVDDERYACDFKKHVHDQLSAVYDIVSAIDDDHYVLGMWRSIPGLEVVQTGYDHQYYKGQYRKALNGGDWYATGGRVTPTAADYIDPGTRRDDTRAIANKVLANDYDYVGDWDWDDFEADDYEWDHYRSEIEQLKYRQPKKTDWKNVDWDDEIDLLLDPKRDDSDREIRSMDIFCHHCDHAWFEHGHHGCTGDDGGCWCDG